MSWVSIDKTKCNDCGLCILRCPGVYSKVDDKIVAEADAGNCIACGHCISLCASQAIVHSEVNMENFPVVDEEANFETGRFIQFIRNRRSHRHFKSKAIPRADLETLIDACRYAPTGGNAQSIEIIVLENREKIKRLSDYTIDFFINAGDKVPQIIEQLAAEGKEPPQSLARIRQYGERFKLAREAGKDPIFHEAPVVMIFHAPPDRGAPKDDCVIASTTMSLLARTMGIESTYIGLLVGAASNNREIHSELRLPPGNEILSVLIMGYPRLKYKYAVDRKPIQTRWEL
jgi:nitroreductase/NAD-dependent dihydropyrimidine dehydrogenase PreA subunit